MKSASYYVLILLGATAALYGLFLDNPIVFDDVQFFLLNEDGHQPVDDYRYSPFELRSLPYASLAWGKAVFGLDMLHFRIENLLLHSATVIALFFFLRSLFAELYGRRERPALDAGAVAFCAAILFALHPIAVYAAGYLVQRSIVMATLFSILAMSAYLHGSARKDNRWLWASVALYYMAVYSKEHAIMLPAILAALTVLLHADWRAELKKRWAMFAVFACIALLVVAAKKGVLGSVYEVYAPGMLESGNELNHPLSVVTQCWLFFKYAALWLFPVPTWMSVDMREPFADSLWSGYLLAFIAFIAWGGLAVRLLLRRGRAGLIGFVLLYPWLMFMTEFSAVRIQESFVLYRSYLWAVGACAALPLLLDLMDRRMAMVVVTAVVLALFPISMERLASFAHPLILWDDAAKLVEGKHELPGVFRIYYNRGSEFIKVDDYEAAIEDLTIAVALNPEWPFSYNNLGAALMKKGDWPAAARAFTGAIEVASRQRMGINPRPYFGRALAYENMGMPDLARQDFELTCRMVNKGCEKLAD